MIARHRMQGVFLKLVGGIAGVCLMVTADGAADTVHMKTDELLKGLVVEEHADRILLSTVDGEKMILRRDVISIQYDDLEYSFMSLGRLMEQKKKYGAALSYYERAYQQNPNLVEARQAALGVKSRMWAQMTEGPVAEIEKQQARQDAWLAGEGGAGLVARSRENFGVLLYDRLGIRLKDETDFFTVEAIRIGSTGHRNGLRRGDRLIRSDGRSLRFLNEQVVMKEFLEPRFSNMTLEIQRSLSLPKDQRVSYKKLGFRMKQDVHGLVVEEVSQKSPADTAGLKKRDVVYAVNGQPTRYMPLKDVIRLIDDAGEEPLVLMINRYLTLARS